MPVKRQFAGALVEYLAVDLARLLGGEKDAERRDGVGPAAAQPLLAHRCRLRVLWRRDRAGHPGIGRWADHVDGDPSGSVFHCNDTGQRDDPELRRTVIALADIAEQSRGRRNHDDPPVILLAKQVYRRSIDIEVAGQVHIDDSLPILGEHVVEHLVAQDPGGVEDDVQPAESVARLLHHRQAIVEFGNGAVIGGRLAARVFDLIDDFLRRRLVRPLAAAAGAGIIDDDLGAVRSHQLGDFGPDPAACSRTDRDPPFEHAHPLPSLASSLARLSRAARFLSIEPAANAA